MSVTPSVREALKQALDTQGREFVYNKGGEYGCYYRPVTEADYAEDSADSPTGDLATDPRARTACLVGTALDILGWNRDPNFTDGIYPYARQHIGELADADVKYLAYAQSHQDAGHSWGESFDVAEEFAKAFE